MPKKMTTTPAPAPAAPPTADTPALTPAASTVLSLLDAHDGTTTVDLVERTGLGRSTVTKALVVLHEAGLAVRQDGGHEGTRRIADRWFAAPGLTAHEAAPADAEGQADDDNVADPAEPVDRDAEEEADTADTIPEPPHDPADEDVATHPAHSEAGSADIGPVPNEPVPDQAADTDSETETDLGGEPDEATSDGKTESADDPAGDEEPDDEPAEAEPTAPDDTEPETGPDAHDPAAEPADEPTEHAVIDGADGSDASNVGYESDSLSVPADQGPDVSGGADDAVPAPEAADGAPSAPRLGKGELRAQVEGHLREHPDRAWTPTAISKVLKRSAGAINNACEKLLEAEAVMTFEDKPRRFQWRNEKDANTVAY